MRQSYYMDGGPCGPVSIAYTDWGDIENPKVLVCVHGLTRNSRDFDYLAKQLSDQYRVISVDVPGRGKSDKLQNSADYIYPNYCAIILRLIAQLGVKQVDWVGTSMGGIIGMMIAAMPGNPIQRMVVNDVGPFLPKEALQRINAYLSTEFHFDTLKDLELHLRTVHAPFGPLTDEHWGHMARHSACQDEKGRWMLGYDPAIKEALKGAVDDDISFWEVWDQIHCPVLLIRGKLSDLLLSETAAEMLTRGPETTLVEFEEIGHAPVLMDVEQTSVIKNWLAGYTQ